MKPNDLGATLLFAVLGMLSLATGHTFSGVFFLILAAVMIGIAIGKNPDNFDK